MAETYTKLNLDNMYFGGYELDPSSSEPTKPGDASPFPSSSNFYTKPSTSAKSFPTVFEWPKSVKLFSSYVLAKKKSVGRVNANLNLYRPWR